MREEVKANVAVRNQLSEEMQRIHALHAMEQEGYAKALKVHIQNNKELVMMIKSLLSEHGTKDNMLRVTRMMKEHNERLAEVYGKAEQDEK